MATPLLSRHRLPGTLGDILVDVRTGRDHSGPAVLILPGFKGFKDWGMFPVLAERLARAGLTAVSWNSSGSGVDDEGNFAWPERFGRFTWTRELADLEVLTGALFDGRLGTAPPTTVGVVGHSRGGGTAVLLAARDRRVGALVTWSAISTVHRWPEETRKRWRACGVLDVVNQRTGEVLPLYPDILDDIDAHGDDYDLEAAAGRVEVPWLLVHGTADETVPFAEAGRLADAARTAALETLLVEGAGHTYGAAHPLVSRPATLERVLEATVRFLSTRLP